LTKCYIADFIATLQMSKLMHSSLALLVEISKLMCMNQKSHSSI